VPLLPPDPPPLPPPCSWPDDVPLELPPEPDPPTEPLDVLEVPVPLPASGPKSDVLVPFAHATT
jgi:hypothetical protein